MPEITALLNHTIILLKPNYVTLQFIPVVKYIVKISQNTSIVTIPTLNVIMKNKSKLNCIAISPLVCTSCHICLPLTSIISKKTQLNKTQYTYYMHNYCIQVIFVMLTLSTTTRTYRSYKIYMYVAIL